MSDDAIEFVAYTVTGRPISGQELVDALARGVQVEWEASLQTTCLNTWNSTLKKEKTHED